MHISKVLDFDGFSIRPQFHLTRLACERVDPLVRRASTFDFRAPIFKLAVLSHFHFGRLVRRTRSGERDGSRIERDFENPCGYTDANISPPANKELPLNACRITASPSSVSCSIHIQVGQTSHITFLGSPATPRTVFCTPS